MYPIPCEPHALVRARLVLADRHCDSAVVGADERITYKPRYRTDKAFYFPYALVQHTEQLFRS